MKEIVDGYFSFPTYQEIGQSKVPKKDRGGVIENFRITFNILKKLV